jgi:dCMP deaminase
MNVHDYKFNTVWVPRWFQLAKLVSSWSKDPSTKIGAVFVSPEMQVLSMGWNGFPRNIKDSQERLENRELKYKFIVHAEMNAIYNATHNGISLNNSYLFVYGLPVCASCSLGVVQVGTKRIYQAFSHDRPEWLKSAETSAEVFREAGILIHNYGVEVAL